MCRFSSLHHLEEPSHCSTSDLLVLQSIWTKMHLTFKFTLHLQLQQLRVLFQERTGSSSVIMHFAENFGGNSHSNTCSISMSQHLYGEPPFFFSDLKLYYYYLQCSNISRCQDTRTRSCVHWQREDIDVNRGLTRDKPLLVEIIDFPSLGTCPADLAAHLLPLEEPQAPTLHEQDQRRPWHACNENTAYFSISL